MALKFCCLTLEGAVTFILGLEVIGVSSFCKKKKRNFLLARRLILVILC